MTLSAGTVRRQVCAGIATSFAFFAAHIRTLPYRFMEDNLLKASTEVHLFILLLLVLAFKSNMEREAYGTRFYDIVAVVLFVVFVPVSFLACVAHKWQTVVSDDVEAAALSTHTAQLQAAFQRHRLGRDKAEDRKLLGDYIAKVEDEVGPDRVLISVLTASFTHTALATHVGQLPLPRLHLLPRAHGGRVRQGALRRPLRDDPRRERPEAPRLPRPGAPRGRRALGQVPAQL